MNRINIEAIKLENVKVSFEIKLLQYKINCILYKYRNKYSFQCYINSFIEELTQAVLKSALLNNDDAQELITKVRDIIKRLKAIKCSCTDGAIDNTLKYILYTYSCNKSKMSIKEKIDMLHELKMLKKEIEDNDIYITNRIKNTFKLMEQLKENIISNL